MIIFATGKMERSLEKNKTAMTPYIVLFVCVAVLVSKILHKNLPKSFQISLFSSYPYLRLPIQPPIQKNSEIRKQVRYFSC